MKWLWKELILVCGFGLLLSVPLYSAEFSVTPYFWATSVDGNISILDQEASVDADFKDILDNVDFAGALHGELWGGPFGIIIDPFYVKLSDNVNSIDVKTDFWLVEGALGFRPFEWEYGDDQEASVALIGGGRYWYTSTEIDPPGLPRVDDSGDWIDPFVGGRVMFDFADWLTCSLQADIGGWGIGDSHDSYNLIGLLGFKFNDNVALMVGYKYLTVDRDEGPAFKYDLTMQGPLLGLKFKW